MKKFIKNISYFLILLFIINLALYYYGNKLYYNKYSSPSLEFDSYLLADSHGGRLYDFTEKYGVYNFSDGGDSYFDMYRKTLYLINNTKVDTIFITVDDHTLTPYREKLNNLDRSIKYCTKNDFNNFYSYLKEAYFNYYIMFFQPKVRSLIKLYFESKIKSIFSPNRNSSQKKRTIKWKMRTIADRIQSSQKRAELQFSEKEVSITLSKSLVDIINICNENSITLIGIKFPLASEYIQVLGNSTSHAQQLFKEKNLKVYDMRNIFINNSEYFENQDHLNKVGGKLFVDKLFSNFRSK